MAVVDPKVVLKVQRFLDAGGVYCDRVARVFGLARELRLIPFKGIYKTLRKDALSW
jgi:L-2-hydroxyglutarate oxidase